jgi:SRSO17 transposase
MRAKEVWKKMTKRLEVAAAPAPLEEYAQHFDELFGKSKKPRRISALCGRPLTAKAERHKTLTGLSNAEPVVGAQQPRAQRLQWFLSESDWDEREVQAERLRLLRQDAASAPTVQGLLVIDETGDRKDGHKTAYGEERALRSGLRKLSVPYVMALKPSHDGRASRGCRRHPARRGARGAMAE